MINDLAKYDRKMINIRRVHLYSTDLANAPAYYQSPIWPTGLMATKRKGFILFINDCQNGHLKPTLSFIANITIYSQHYQLQPTKWPFTDNISTL